MGATMIAVWAVVVMLFGHWTADFVWQPHWMSIRKSKENWVLFQHALRIFIVSYIVAIVVGSFQGTHIPLGGMLAFALVNGCSHYWIDYFTSRRNAKLWQAERVHDFFTTIGFDQFLHLAIATATLMWVVS